jgi:hypothetical protein
LRNSPPDRCAPPRRRSTLRAEGDRRQPLPDPPTLEFRLRIWRTHGPAKASKKFIFDKLLARRPLDLSCGSAAADASQLDGIAGAEVLRSRTSGRQSRRNREGQRLQPPTRANGASFSRPSAAFPADIRAPWNACERRVLSDLTGEALIAAMQASPHRDIDIEPKRAPMPVRQVVL